MASLQEIDARRRATPIFAKARKVEQRLTLALGLGPNHRLTRLRSKVRYALREFNAQGMAEFLALWEPCFDHTIAMAYRRAEEDIEARPAESSVVWGMVA